MGWRSVGLWGALAGEWVVTVCQICMLNTKGKVEEDERLNPTRFDLFPSNHAKCRGQLHLMWWKNTFDLNRGHPQPDFLSLLFFKINYLLKNKHKTKPRLLSFQIKQLKPQFSSWAKEVSKVLHESLRNKVVQLDVKGSAKEREKERKKGEWRGELCHMNTKQRCYPGSLARVPAAMTWQTGSDVRFVNACLWMHLFVYSLNQASHLRTKSTWTI